jgi:hypothetical protein
VGDFFGVQGVKEGQAIASGQDEGSEIGRRRKGFENRARGAFSWRQVTVFRNRQRLDGRKDGCAEGAENLAVQRIRGVPPLLTSAGGYLNTPTRSFQLGALWAAEAETDRSDTSEVSEIGAGFREIGKEWGFPVIVAELQNRRSSGGDRKVV